MRRLFSLFALTLLACGLVAPTAGAEPARAAVVARTVANRVRAALKRLIVRDGIPADEVDRELLRVSKLLGDHCD